MIPSVLKNPRRSRGRALLAAMTLAVALPANALSATGYNTASPSYVASTGAVAGVEFVPLINTGETAFGDMFEGIPDGIGAVPAPGNQGWVDLYVNHEQSHVPFSGFADFVDSSVTRVRVDVASQSIIDMSVPLSPSLGFIRFCSSFMAGPEEGFPHYTLITNEESNDIIPVPAGAPYGADPALAPNRQAGYSVALDTVTGKITALSAAGRHNHENQVVVPGGWDGIYALSGDDTFTAPSSQLYLFGSPKWQRFVEGDGTLWAFRVTATDEGAVDATDPFNDANDFLEIQPGDTWSGEFIPVPDDVARGLTGEAPQAALENWSNANNVFQFVRVEDIDYDPDDPRTVYFADTGTTRLVESGTTGRLFRGPSGTGTDSNGRIFKIVLNEDDPTVVDEFSILADANQLTPVMRAPDNLDVGHDSIMVQEDASNSKVWMYAMGAGTWTHVATGTISDAETSGILDVSAWFGAGWWALDVQVHDPTRFVDQEDVPGQTYDLRREDGQLLLMHVPGS